ncbi:MAG: ATP-binding cassette domain-containing protein [Bdellovibrionales bacterium]
MNVIETTALSRNYKTYKKPEGVMSSIKGFWNREYIEKQALKPTTLSIGGGQIVGLVGANGAGKTTLLKLLAGLIYPTGGDAKILGYRPWERRYEYLRRISILLGQKNQLWWDIPPVDSYNLLAKIYDLDPNVARKRVEELATLLACTDQLQVQLRRLSLGERMKMEIVGSLLHSPDVLFLDEPTIGLDVVAQSTIRDFLSSYVKNHGPTVILTSHYMDDIATLADRLLLISQGAIVYDGTVKRFIQKAEPTQQLHMKFFEPLAQEIQLANGVLCEKGKTDLILEIAVSEMASVISQLTRSASVQELKIEEANFEDVIRKFLEKESRVLSSGSTVTARI